MIVGSCDHVAQPRSKLVLLAHMLAQTENKIILARADARALVN